MLSMQKNCVENEQHFLMYCQGYATIRVELHSHISNKDALYANLSDNERTKYLLRADNRVTSNIIGKYINLMFKKKKRDSQLTNEMSIIIFFFFHFL